MDRWLQDFRFAIRTLTRQPAFTFIAVLTIGLAIGANSSIYSVVRAVLLRQLPYQSPEELVVVWANLTARDRPKFPLSPPDLEDMRNQTSQFAGFAGITTFQQALTGGDGVPEQVDMAGVTANFLELLGVQPIVGRGFTPDEDDPIGPNVAPGAAPPQTVLISEGLWTRQFGRASDIVGRSIEINNNPVQVIGVLPEDVAILFGPGSGLVNRVDLWTTVRLNVAAWPTRANVIWRVVGRMKPGVSIETARADIERLSNSLLESDPRRQTSGWRMEVFPMIDDLTAHVKPTLWPLFGAVGFVLLIACANVSNLFLARASTREREFAIRSALGGARQRIVRQLMVESGVVALAGGLLGLALSWGGIRLLLALRPANLPRLDSVGIDGSVMGFTLLAAVVSAFLFGLVPAYQASNPQISGVLKDRGRSAMQKGHRVFRNSLVVAQVALSVVLLIGAGLMVRSFVAQQRVELGYQPGGLLTFQLNVPGQRYPTPQLLSFYRQLEDQVRSVPGVTSVSAAFPIPLIDAQFNGRYGPPEALGDETRYGQADYRSVRPGYFDVMGTRLLEGRTFTEADFRDSAQVVVIDRKLAGILWPGRSAVGERMLIRATTLEPQFVEVIGVVEHQRSAGVAIEGPEQVFLTDTYMGTPGFNYWVIRTTIDPVSLVPQVRRVLQGLDPQLPLSDIRTMTDRVDEAMTGARFSLVLIGVFGSIALVLAAVGIYGVLSFTVRQRTAEFGVRMALGADTSTILRLVVRQGLTLTGIGLGVGLLAGFWATRLMGNLLVGVSPNDPLTYAVMTTLFVVAALGASYAPARRATRVDPVVALREEGE